MLPKIFDFLKGDLKKPILFTAILIFLAILVGSLDAVAPIVSIFFLLCYGGVNVACFLLDYLGSPNWRPKWKFHHKASSFMGLLLCFTLMVSTSYWAALASLAGAVAIYLYLERKSQEKNWGDGIEGMRAERARNALLKIDKGKKHVKNWRPHYLALGHVNEKGKISAPGIFKLLHQLRKGTGLAIYGCVVKGDYTTEAYAEARKQESFLDAFLKQHKYNVFTKVIVSQNIENGMIYLIQSAGLGGLEPNTLLLAWPSQWENDDLKTQRFVNLINHAHTFGYLITVLKPQKMFNSEVKHTGSIDVWSFIHERGMLLLMANILIKSTTWKRCKVRLFLATTMDESNNPHIIRVMRQYLDKYRLFESIEIHVIRVTAEEFQQFSHDLTAKMQQNQRQLQERGKEDKDFEYGEAPVLMSLAALQQKDVQATLEYMRKRGRISINEEDWDEKMRHASSLNSKILRHSKNASLVITNLPPRYEGQSHQEYMQFCQSMTEGVERLLFIENSGKEVMTQYS